MSKFNSNIDIAEFEFIETLYKSNNSLITKVLHKQTQKYYVLKTNSQLSDELLELLRNEYELTKNFDTDKLVRNLALIPNGVGLAILQEYVEDSKSLKDFISEKSLRLDVFFEYAKEIVKSLMLVHEQDIIHQDINPNNILVGISSKKIRLIDFGISVRLEKRYAEVEGVNQLKGTLQYISPEQTGRMNRAVDYRSDFYSLGITFYEMITGQTPFQSDDSMELVYAHIANTPPQANIPQAIYQIIEKLIKKNAEERYQSAAGILSDLTYLEQEQQKGNDLNLLSFEVGTQDFSPKLQILQKLYGRSEQRKVLLDTFEQICQEGVAQLSLVQGYSGVGKSALINEIHKPITQKKGYFISGKYDQFQRNIPYAALVQAFEKLVDYMITSRAERVAQWKNQILNVLGQNAKVITDLIPSLELVIGKQPEVEELGATESQNRLLYLLGNFIEVISVAEHPIVLFIDDLQWADLASLQLLQKILQNPKGLYLMVIGAYRNNEVDDSHPLMMILKEIEKSETSIQNIVLNNLTSHNVEELLSDALQSSADQLTDLVNLIQEKTQGNPFFVNRFLSNLYDEKLLKFDLENKKWVWNIEQIRSQNLTDNVVDFLTKQLVKLPAQTIELLQLASAIGNTFEIDLLKNITQKELYQLQDDLAIAEKENFISKIQGKYRFQHDRLQQASYLSLTEEKRTIFHYQIGNSLLAHNQLEIELFDIVYQLYEAKNILTSEEKFNLLELHIKAGEKAINSIAYASANQYLNRALEDLPANAWEKHYDLCKYLYENLIESEFLNGNIEISQKYAHLMIENLKTDLEKTKILNVLVMQSSLQGKFQEGIDLGIKTLEILGYPVPVNELEAGIGGAFGAVAQHLAGRDILEVFKQDDVKDEQAKLAIALRATLAPAAFLSGQNTLWAYLISSGTALSLEKGNSVDSCTLYSSYGILCGAIFSDYVSGYNYGQLALNLSEKYNNQRMKGTVMFVIGAFLHLWIKPVKTHQAVYVEGLQAALASGEKLFAGFLLGQSLIGIAEEGRTLKEMMEKYEEYEKIAIKTQNSSGLDYLVPHSLYYAYLNFADAKERLLSHENKNEKYYFDKLSKSNPTVYTVSLLYKIQSSFVLEKWTETQEILSILENYLPTLGGTVVQIAWLCLEPIFDNFLIVKGLAKEEELAKRLEASMPKLRQMATLNPENFARYVDMLDGILAWKNENYIEAMQKIESAVEKSKQSGNLFDIGIFSELASHFYKKINHKKLEESYIQDAYFAYKRWGAKLKVEQLEQEYPFLLVKTVIGQTKMATTRHTMFESKHSSTGSSNELDIISLSKATQSIMGEVVLEKLLSKLIKIVIENAGAQRGILLLPKNDELVVEAQINGEQIELLTSVSLAECSEKNILPVKVINYVQRTQKSLLLANASDNTELLNKRYIDSQKTKSLLAMPLLNQGKLAAVLYLENNLLTGAFTEERLLILNILSTQIAIAIDNALLYANLEQKVEQRTAELNKTNGNLQVMIRQVEKQREIITEKNENITASINYARNIQRAMLPFQTKIESAFGENNFFVMYMPRDIVSGDFYFFEQILTSQHQRLSFFAVADCTGHGIPGAFMSMIGNQILHEIIIKNKVYEANRILESLHKGVRQALRQEQTDNNDGMDILITVLHQNTDSNVFEEIDYSGAMNPFYYVTFPVDAPAEFKEIKATKRAIGGKQKEEERLFENHKIVLNETTILYLSTDGFQDQFGGAENRKFLTKRFRELLFSVSNLPLNEQKDILENTINSWIGSYHQTDDITIVGLKLN